ncbi:hypothetical protein QMZ92_32230 [Streptomyces sp. HNM0645]|uniref:hypothetical protein n=1 Tax=Streptomyces sp. HNM0645 TaxID=2782343 RepID=UPI0024B66DA6|nr:hypothetical protein [Streptomyces sp. HNM0645]MDI9888895.1 hypothetical protein [Streptomyces sp. HNM0645]
MEPFQGTAACDDVTLILVRTRALSPTQAVSRTLPRDQSAVRHAQDLGTGRPWTTRTA